MESAEGLLERVHQAVAEFEAENDHGGDPYNIFQVLGVADKEVFLCRMLADLINPEGLHGMGDKYLRSFADQVLQLGDIGEDFFRGAVVKKEYCIPLSSSGRVNRRIDIVVESRGFFIPIEIKTGSADREAQCYDTYMYAKEQMGSEEAIVYYLSPDGSPPSGGSTSAGFMWPDSAASATGLKAASAESVWPDSAASATGLETAAAAESVWPDSGTEDNGCAIPEGGLVTLSFRTDICRWLRSVIAAEKDGRVKDTVIQFLRVVEDLTGAVGYEEAKLVERMILKDSGSFEAGLWIEETMEQAKIRLITDLMEEIGTGWRLCGKNTG